MMRIGMSAAALMLLAPLFGTVQAQGPITIAAGTTTAVQVTPGSQFSVPLLVDMSQAAGGNLASLTTAVTWEATRITLDSILPGGFGFLTANTTNAAAGNALLSMFNATGTTATVTFATVWFTAGTAVGGTQLLLNLSAAGDQLGTNILAELQARSLGVCVAKTGLWGDVNADGVVNILDAQQIARYSVGLSVANLVAVQTLGDVTADSSVNIIDAQQIARFSVALSAAARVNTVRFLPPTVAALTVSPNPDTVVVGGTGQLLAAPTDSVGNALTGCATVSWASSDTATATVSSSGVVTGHAVGTVTITASANGHAAATAIQVEVEPQSLTPAEVQALAVTSVDSWYIGATQVDPWVMLNVTGDLMTMNYGNFGARFNNLEPRIAYNNNQASGDAEVAQDPWTSQYAALGQANDVLGAVAGGVVLPGGSAKYSVLADLAQAGALMELALVYDQAFPVDETTMVPTLQPYSTMATFAQGKIDKLIAATAGQSYTYTSAEFPVSVNPPGTSYSVDPVGGGATAANLNALANTWGAQLLAYSPRTAAQASSVNWAQVLAYAQKGIGAGSSAPGTPLDFAVIGNYNNIGGWWSDLVSYFDLPSWMMIDLHLVSQMAPNVPNEYTGLPASPTSAYDAVWAPVAPMDARLGIDTTNVNAYTAGTDDKTDFVYARQVQGDPSRGIYMQSPYYHVRYIHYSYQSNSPQTGPAVYVLAAENDLLQAEALVRSGGNMATAASLVNKTRVGRGGLAPLTASTSTATFLQAITYELEVECVATDGYGFFALRGMDQLQDGTLRDLPVPAVELEALGLPVYTFGGVGQPDMSVSGTRTFGVPALIRAGVLPNALSLTHPKPPRHPAPQIRR